MNLTYRHVPEQRVVTIESLNPESDYLNVEIDTDGVYVGIPDGTFYTATLESRPFAAQGVISFHDDSGDIPLSRIIETANTVGLLESRFNGLDNRINVLESQVLYNSSYGSIHDMRIRLENTERQIREMESRMSVLRYEIDRVRNER